MFGGPSSHSPISKLFLTVRNVRGQIKMFTLLQAIDFVLNGCKPRFKDDLQVLPVWTIRVSVGRQREAKRTLQLWKVCCMYYFEAANLS